MKKQKDIVEASIERVRADSQGPHHSTSQVKVVRLNNFVGASGNRNKKETRASGSRHSHSGLGAGNSKENVLGTKIKKSLKVVGNQKGTSPYLNNCFTKGGVTQTSTNSNPAETTSTSSSKVRDTSAASASAEVSESSLIVLKQANKSTKN